MTQYSAHTMTEAGVLVGFKIHNPDGSALLIKCAGGTTPEEAWAHIQALVQHANARLSVPAGSGGTATVTFVGGERSGGKTYRVHRLAAEATPDSPVYMHPDDLDARYAVETRCSVCGRTCVELLDGTACNFPQPDGSRCPGVLKRA